MSCQCHIDAVEDIVRSMRLVTGAGDRVKKIQLTILMLGLGTSSIVLSGCNVGPTYGTGKSAGQQLMDDVSSIASLRPMNTAAQVETRPRPELVPPAADMRATLPPPQESITQSAQTEWPESPEERRQRLRDEATANRDNPNYVSPIEPGRDGYNRRQRPTDLNRAGEERIPVVSRAEARQQRAAYQKVRQENSGGTATQRKYLSEPPLAYRQPADTAPIDETGVDEAQKERHRKAALASKEGKKRWWPF